MAPIQRSVSRDLSINDKQFYPGGAGDGPTTSISRCIHDFCPWGGQPDISQVARIPLRCMRRPLDRKQLRFRAPEGARGNSLHKAYKRGEAQRTLIRERYKCIEYLVNDCDLERDRITIIEGVYEIKNLLSYGLPLQGLLLLCPIHRASTIECPRLQRERKRTLCNLNDTM